VVDLALVSAGGVVGLTEAIAGVAVGEWVEGRGRLVPGDSWRMVGVMVLAEVVSLLQDLGYRSDCDCFAEIERAAW
jgi:hypothetical protein